MTPGATYSTSNQVAKITISRPEFKNALNQETVKSLTEFFNKASSDSSVKAVIFSGAGTEAFCAGADLKELQAAQGLSARREFFSGIAELVKAISTCEKPVVAAVQGFALAGGCGLAAAADIVLASEDAVFGLPEIKLGLLPMIVMAPIGRVIGVRALSELVLTGEQIDATRALQIGLITRIVPKAELLAEAEKTAATLAAKSSATLALGKKTIYELRDPEYLKSLDQLAEQVAKLSLTADAAEGIKAFFEKRKPVWLSN